MPKGTGVIHLIVGEDIYKRRAAVNIIAAASSVAAEVFDGGELTENQLADCIAGATLFSNERLVIIHELSANKPLWDKLADWLGRVTADTTLILLEPKPDRRGKAYKTIAKAAAVTVAEPWSDRQAGEAVAWLQKQNPAITRTQAEQMVQRALVPAERPGAYSINQQALQNALDSLSVLDEITDDAIAAVLPESHADNVFELLDTALSGNAARTQELLQNVMVMADPYMTLGFIMSQWSQLAALKISNTAPDELAGAIGASPYVLKKLQRHAAALSHARVGELTKLLARLDVQSKTTGADPWDIVARFIGELAK